MKVNRGERQEPELETGPASATCGFGFVENPSNAIPPSELARCFDPATRGSRKRYNRYLVRHLYAQTLRQLFDVHAANWLSETAWLSSVTAMKRNQHFRSLLALGDWSASFALEALQAGDYRIHWFALLQDVLKTDPVPAHSRRLREMAQAWLDYGRANGLI